MPKRSLQDLSLTGLVFAITGTLTVPRAEFEEFIGQNGGAVAKSVTKAVTHLVSSETNTKKCIDAEKKGVEVVDEQWVRNKVDASAGKKPAAKKASATSAQGGDENSWLGRAKVARRELAEAQVASAKEKDWSYDPRPAINPEEVSLSFVLQLVGEAEQDNILSKVVEGVTERVLANLKPKSSKKKVAARKIDSLLAQTKSDLDMGESDDGSASATEDVLDHDQLCAYAVYRWIDQLDCAPPTSFVHEVVAKQIRAATSHTADTTSALIDVLADALLQSANVAQIPLPESPFNVDSVPDVYDDDEEGDLSWCEQFSKHMVWLFGALDEKRCNSIAKIKTCLRTSSKHKMFTRAKEYELPDNEEEDSEDDQNNTNNFLRWIRHKYSSRVSPRYLNDLSEEQVRHLSAFELLTARVDPRTYFGTFCYNVRESDYCGSLSGIAGYASDMAEEVDSIFGFLQCVVMGLSIDEMDARIQMPNTHAFYVPGMKHDLFDDGDDYEGNNEDNDEDN